MICQLVFFKAYKSFFVTANKKISHILLKDWWIFKVYFLYRAKFLGALLHLVCRRDTWYKIFKNFLIRVLQGFFFPPLKPKYSLKLAEMQHFFLWKKVKFHESDMNIRYRVNILLIENMQLQNAFQVLQGSSEFLYFKWVWWEGLGHAWGSAAKAFKVKTRESERVVILILSFWLKGSYSDRNCIAGKVQTQT